MFEVLRVNSSLTQLELNVPSLFLLCFPFILYSNNNDIGDLGVSSLQETLKVNSSLTHLKLRAVSPLFAFAILFHFTENHIGSPGALCISNALKVNSSLTRLFLGDILLLMIFKIHSLFCCVSLENYIGELGASYFSGALMVNSTLKMLDLHVISFIPFIIITISPFRTAFYTLEHYHYQRHSKRIRSSHHWT